MKWAAPILLAATAAGPLPLAIGTYVQVGTACDDPPFAAMRSYDGRGIADPHSRACRSRVTARAAGRLTVATSCIMAGEGPAPRQTWVETLRPEGRAAFAVLGAGEPVPYRLCPPSPAFRRSSR